MRTTPFDFTQKLFPFNIHRSKIPLHRTHPFFLQPIRMADPTPAPTTPAPHPIQPKPIDNNNNNNHNQNPPKDVPPPPEKPEPGDCCGSGCVRCVWDIYYDELEEYNKLYKHHDSNAKPS